MSPTNNPGPRENLVSLGWHVALPDEKSRSPVAESTCQLRLTKGSERRKVSRRRVALVALCALVVIVGGWMLSRTHAAEPAPTPAGQVGEPSCPIATLPHEVVDTVKRIHTGGPFPFPRSDGAVFTNREGHLPKQRMGYYHEYTVITARAQDRSMKRIVTGGTPLANPTQYFYTGNHYDSFCLVTDVGTRR